MTHSELSYVLFSKLNANKNL